MNNKNARSLIVISLSLIVVAMGLLIFLPSPEDEYVSDIAMMEPAKSSERKSTGSTFHSSPGIIPSVKTAI